MLPIVCSKKALKEILCWQNKRKQERKRECRKGTGDSTQIARGPRVPEKREWSGYEQRRENGQGLNREERSRPLSMGRAGQGRGRATKRLKAP